MAESKIGDITTRLVFYSESDALDFKKTGRAVLVVEDGVAELPLPAGEDGKPGPAGPKGDPLRPDLVLDETTDSAALAVLQQRSSTWRTTGVDRTGFFALNKPTKSGFFYSRSGWSVIRDIFGGASEITAGEFLMPTYFRNVDAEPEAPADGCVVYSSNNELKVKKADGTVVKLA